MTNRIVPRILILAMVASIPAAAAQQHRAPAVKSLRLFVFDCGVLKIADPGRYHLKPEEVATTNMSVACFLIAHPKGTMMWDVGVIPDSSFKPGGAPLTVEYPTSVATVAKPLVPQLAAVGYVPADIAYLALSHFHYDHVANANVFVGFACLVRTLERDVL